MYTPEDIIDARTNAGVLHLTVTPAALIRTLVLIGQLPVGRLRTALLASYSGLESVEVPTRFMDLTPKGITAAHPLGPADIMSLPLLERIAFLKGIERLMGPRLGKAEAKYCICHMPAGVLLPIAAFASLLRDVGHERGFDGGSDCVAHGSAACGTCRFKGSARALDGRLFGG